MWELAWYWYVIAYVLVCPIASTIIFLIYNQEHLSGDEFAFIGIGGALFPFAFLYFIIWWGPMKLAGFIFRLRKDRKNRRQTEEEKKKADEVLKRKHEIDSESSDFRSKPKKHIRCVGDY